MWQTYSTWLTDAKSQYDTAIDKAKANIGGGSVRGPSVDAAIDKINQEFQTGRTDLLEGETFSTLKGYATKMWARQLGIYNTPSMLTSAERPYEFARDLLHGDITMEDILSGKTYTWSTRDSTGKKTYTATVGELLELGTPAHITARYDKFKAATGVEPTFEEFLLVTQYGITTPEDATKPWREVPGYEMPEERKKEEEPVSGLPYVPRSTYGAVPRSTGPTRQQKKASLVSMGGVPAEETRSPWV